MEVLDIEKSLKSMSVLIDTREQPSERANQRFNSFGVPFRRKKLNYGDYTYNFILPNGEQLHEEDKPINPDVVIERKKDLEELSQCFCQSRERFKAEFERAKQNNASVYLLVEDATWEKLLRGKYKTRFNSKAYTASLVAWMIRYDIKIIFCRHETSGELIKEILYRELKNKLEGGFYG